MNSRRGTPKLTVIIMQITGRDISIRNSPSHVHNTKRRNATTSSPESSTSFICLLSVKLAPNTILKCHWRRPGPSTTRPCERFPGWDAPPAACVDNPYRPTLSQALTNILKLYKIRTSHRYKPQITLKLLLLIPDTVIHICNKNIKAYCGARYPERTLRSEKTFPI